MITCPVMKVFEIDSTFCANQDEHNDQVARHLLICLDKSCNKALDYWVKDPQKHKIINMVHRDVLRCLNSQMHETDAMYGKLYKQLQSIDAKKQTDEALKIIQSIREIANQAFMFQQMLSTLEINSKRVMQ